MPNKRAPAIADTRIFSHRPSPGEEFLREFALPIAPQRDPVPVFKVITHVIREGSTSSDGSQAGVWTVQFLDGSPEDGYLKRFTWISWDPERRSWVDNAVLIHEWESRGVPFVPGRLADVPSQLPPLA